MGVLEVCAGATQKVDEDTPETQIGNKDLSH